MTIYVDMKGETTVSLERGTDGFLRPARINVDLRSSESGLSVRAYEIDETGEEVPIEDDEEFEEVWLALPGELEFDL